jgi:transcriptional antiterminator RfaH
MKYWYVIHTLSNQELRAELNLKRQGYFVYLPKYLGIRKHARKVDRILKPLFPRYIFVKLDLDYENISSINSTFGVNKIVALGSKPNILPNFVVNNLKLQEDKDGNLDSIINSIYKFGENVKIQDGALKGNNVIFMGKSDTQRVFVLLNILGRKLNIAVPSMALQAL